MERTGQTYKIYDERGLSTNLRTGKPIEFVEGMTYRALLKKGLWVQVLHVNVAEGICVYQTEPNSINSNSMLGTQSLYDFVLFRENGPLQIMSKRILERYFATVMMDHKKPNFKAESMFQKFWRITKDIFLNKPIYVSRNKLDVPCETPFHAKNKI